MKKKSIKLRTINIRFLIVIGLLCISLVFSTIQLVNQFTKYKESSDLYSDVSKAAIDLQEGSDYLTDEARFFVLINDYEHLINYFKERNENRRREKSIERLSTLHSEPIIIDSLNKSLAESHNLEEMEIYSMALVVKAKHFDENPDLIIPEEIKAVKFKPEDEILSDDYKIAKAWLLLFSEEYMSKKYLISNYKSNAISHIFTYTENSYETSYEHLKDIFVNMIFIIALVFIFNLLLFICIIHLVIRPLRGYITNIKEGSKLKNSHTQEFNILTTTYNEMYDKNEANEILLRHNAEHDELTGLINRRAYNQILGVLTNMESPFALILIDVDFFKLINDNYGHPVGDKVLQRIAKVLQENFRTSDYVARIGGDEFAVLLTDCSNNYDETKNLISAKMEQIKSSLAKEEDDTPTITLSCGIGFSNKGYNNTLYEHADIALYDIKRSGRNGFTFYEDEMEKLISQMNIDN